MKADGAGAADAGGGADGGGNAGSDAAGGADAQGPGDKPKVLVENKPPLIEIAGYGGATTPSCQAVDAKGKPLADPGDFIISATGGVLDKGTLSFAKPANALVTCSSAQTKASGSGLVCVLHPGLNQGLAGLSSGLLVLDAKDLAQALTGQTKAMDGFVAWTDGVASAADSAFDKNAKLLLPHPKGLPSAAALLKAGVKMGPDDKDWPGKLDAVGAALKAMQVAIDKLPKGPVADGDVTAVGSALSGLQKSLVSLEQAKPSPIALVENLAKVESLLTKQLPDLLTSYMDEVGAQAKAAAKASPGQPPAKASQALMQQSVVAAGTLRDLLTRLSCRTNGLVLGLIADKHLGDTTPLKGGTPSITGIYGFSQAVTPCTKLNLLGENFGSKPGLCGAILITYKASGGTINKVKSILGKINNLQTIGKQGLWSATKESTAAVEELTKYLGMSATKLSPQVGKNVILMWSQPDSSLGGPAQTIRLGVVPKQANDFWLPKMITLYPICRTHGSGPKLTVNVMKAGC